MNYVEFLGIAMEFLGNSVFNRLSEELPAIDGCLSVSSSSESTLRQRESETSTVLVDSREFLTFQRVLKVLVVVMTVFVGS